MNDDASRGSSAEVPEDFLSAAWRRVKEHRIAQWTVGYVALAYGIQHAVTLTSEAYEWPNLVTRLSMTLLVVGLPIVMTLAWYHGEKSSRRMSGPELTIISLLLLTSSLLFAVLVHPAGIATPRAQEASVIAARAAAASPKGAVSVAVLPFLDLSPAKDQDFFSDGMTEEITAALAKVPDLRVVARTSAFEFKGKNVNIKTMGEQLGATHLIEGSVRKAGNRLRITAQLIKADDGTHVWAEDYDRELTDVFAIQEDIARAITASLHMTLGLKAGENLVNNRSIDPESYQQYLRAKQIIEGREGQSYDQAVALLESLVNRNPSYAPAWFSLASAYYGATNRLLGNDERSVDELRPVVKKFFDKGVSAVQRAIAIEPNNAQGYSDLGVVAWTTGNPLEAAAYFEKALAIDPYSAGALDLYAVLLSNAGHTEEALAMNMQARLLEPFLPGPARDQVNYLWLSGKDDAAVALAKTLRPFDRAPALSRIYASSGRFADAAEALTELSRDSNNFAAAQEAIRLLRRVPMKKPPAQLAWLPQGLSYVYLYVGAPERVMDSLERRLALGFINAGSGQGPSVNVWHPSHAPVRMTARFKAYVRAAGLVDFWRAKGWPPQCHPTTGDDFECS